MTRMLAISDRAAECQARAGDIRRQANLVESKHVCYGWRATSMTHRRRLKPEQPRRSDGRRMTE